MQQTKSADENGEKISTEKPYLLLDIRPEDQYDSGHIVTAKSYPHVRLARAVNFETKEMLAYKVDQCFIFSEGINVLNTSVRLCVIL